jgi:hypothetical protein
MRNESRSVRCGYSCTVRNRDCQSDQVENWYLCGPAEVARTARLTAYVTPSREGEEGAVDSLMGTSKRAREARSTPNQKFPRLLLNPRSGTFLG